MIIAYSITRQADSTKNRTEGSSATWICSFGPFRLKLWLVVGKNNILDWTKRHFSLLNSPSEPFPNEMGFPNH